MIEPDFAFPYLQKQQFDIILAADRGLEFCYHYQIMPTYILGDFDSLSPEILNYYKDNHVAPIREFNPMKDNTDLTGGSAISNVARWKLSGIG